MLVALGLSGAVVQAAGAGHQRLLTSRGFVQSPSRPQIARGGICLRPREERQRSEDETGRHPQASARLALESLDGLLARIDRLPLVGVGSLVTLMPLAS